MFICADCGRFIKRGEEECRTIPQFGEPADPEFEYVHRTCPPKRGDTK